MLVHRTSTFFCLWLPSSSVKVFCLLVKSPRLKNGRTHLILTLQLLSGKLKFAIAEFEQQNRSVNIELDNLKNALCSSNRSRAMAKQNANRAEFKLEISEKVTSDLFDVNKELKKQIEEETSKTESLQNERLIKQKFS